MGIALTASPYTQVIQWRREVGRPWHWHSSCEVVDGMISMDFWTAWVYGSIDFICAVFVDPGTFGNTNGLDQFGQFEAFPVLYKVVHLFPAAWPDQ